MRRKKNITKLGFTFVILLLSLASISYSQAAWYDTITITGTVTTGEWRCEETAWARMVDDPENFEYEFLGSNWATYIIVYQPIETIETLETFYLYAGQEYRAGELDVWRDDDYLYVQYILDDGVTMSETHLHINTSLDGIPQNNGNPIPGQFEYKEDHNPSVNGYLYTIPWDDEFWDGQDLYIAAHAVVWSGFGDCLPCNFDC
jgi:hypothetical protein